MFTSNRTLKWVENLAEQEALVSSGEKTSIDLTATKESVLSDETTLFLRDLFQHLDALVKAFNGRVGEKGLGIRLLRNSENLESYTLQRNGQRLVINKSRSGVIQLQCEKILPADNKTTMMFSGIVEAQFGLFDDVEWHFLGSSLSAEQLARHYLTEFIQSSRTV